MKSDYKRIAKHSFIYGLGGAISKAVGFIMIPVYTRYLTPADYGILELLILTTNILTVFLTLGLSSATLRIYFDYDKEDVRKKVIGTALIASIVIAFCGAILANLFREKFSLLWFGTSEYSLFFTLVLLAMAFEIAMEVPLSYIRVKEFSYVFVFVVLSRLIVALSLNILFVVYYNMGIKGILMSNLITSAVFGIGLIIFTFAKTTIAFTRALFRQLIVYGWPLIFSGCGFFIIHSSDRIFLKHYSTLDEIGLYSLAVRFVSVLPLVVMEPFWRMYGPYRFSIMKRDDAKHVYSSVQKGMLFIVITCGLAIILLSNDVLKVLTTPAFYGAYNAIPFLVLGVVCRSAYYLVQTGIYVEKKTKLIAKMVWIAVLVNLVSNYILIPKFGMVGAGQAQFATYFVLAIMTYFVSQKLYYIRYYLGSNLVLIIGGVIVWIISNFILFENICLRIALNGLLLMTYGVIMTSLLFVTPKQIIELLSKKVIPRIQSF